MHRNGMFYRDLRDYEQPSHMACVPLRKYTLRPAQVRHIDARHSKSADAVTLVSSPRLWQHDSAAADVGLGMLAGYHGSGAATESDEEEIHG